MDTKALRQKILDLAIRGKLVPQDPNDEPASVLLERIRAEKQQLVKDGKLKAKDIKNDSIIFLGDDNLHYEKFHDGTVKCIEDEIPFELPEGWEWCRLFQISEIITGSTPSKKNSEYYGNECPFFKPNDLEQGANVIHASEYLSTEGKKVSRVIPSGSTAVCCIGSIGKCGYLQKEGTTNQQINSIVPYIHKKFVFYYCLTNFFVEQLLLEASATTIAIVNKNKMSNVFIPVPPLSEQEEISKKLDTLIRFIDEINLEKESLAEAIQQTKSKILDLAIRGKLVPQNPDDEPASVLLDRISAEKEELIKQGKIKRDKKESVIFRGDDNSYYEKISDTVICIDEELPFKLPDGWTWVRLQTCCQKEIKRGKSPKYTESSGTLVFAQKCNTKYDGINMDLALYLDGSTLVKYPDDEYMQDKDTVINSTGTGTLGRVGIYRRTDNRREMPVVPDSHITVIRANNEISAAYIYHSLKAYQQELEKLGEGSTNQKELKPLTLKNLIVALPPYAEQERIIEIITAAFEIMTNIEKSLS